MLLPLLLAYRYRMMVTPGAKTFAATIFSLVVLVLQVAAQIGPGQCDAIIVVTDMSTSQLRVFWNCEDNNVEYQVTYQLINRDQCDLRDDREDPPFHTQTTSWSHSNPQNLSNLYPYSTYRVTLQSRLPTADNSYVYETKLDANVTTNEASPTGIPSSVQSFGVTTKQMSFIWEEIPCGHRRGEITYQYEFKNDRERLSADVDERVIRFAHLTPCSVYSFRVAAKNKAGIGEYSAEISSPTQAVAPGPVANLQVIQTTSPHELDVQWQPPSGICDVEQYEVKYKLVDRSQCQLQTETVFHYHGISMETNARIRKLYAYSTYTIAVSARNSAGLRAETEMNGTTLEAVPDGQPENVHVTKATSTTLEFIWDVLQCETTNGQIKSYYYTLTSQYSLMTGQVISTRQDFHGLIPDVYYVFRVAAVNNVGQGQYSEGVTQWTSEDVPAKPENVVVSDTGIDFLLVQWSAPDPPHGEIIGYDLSYERAGTFNAHVFEIINNITTLEFLLRDLKSETLYTITVRAETRQGKGPWSASAKAATFKRAKQILPSYVFIILGTTAVVSVLAMLVCCISAFLVSRFRQAPNMGVTMSIPPRPMHPRLSLVRCGARIPRTNTFTVETTLESSKEEALHSTTAVTLDFSDAQVSNHTTIDTASAETSFSHEKLTYADLDVLDMESAGFGASSSVFCVGFKRGSYMGFQKAAAKRPTRNRLMRNEVDILKKVHHPNIVTFLTYIEEGTNHLIITEFAEHGSLYQYFEKHPEPLSERLHQRWVLNLAYGVEYLHGIGVLHRDIKSPNCLVCEEFVLKLCDFGLSRVTAISVTTSREKGTHRWMAPEVLTSHKHSTASDVYAMAMVFLEMCTRKVPFHYIPESFSVAWRVGNEQIKPDIPSNCPNYLKDVLPSCWNSDYHERPTASDVINHIKNFGPSTTDNSTD